MKHDGVTLRITAILAELLLLASLSADASGLHRCPHHDMPAAAVTSATHHAAPAAGRGHMHTAEGADADGADEDDGSTASHGCTCLGCCDFTNRPIPSRSALAPAAAPDAQCAPHVATDQTRPHALFYLLPEPNPPPIV